MEHVFSEGQVMKPEWLKELEEKRRRGEYCYNLCRDCKHFGRPVRHTRYRGKEDCLVHECDIHPGCMNTRYSVGCADWEEML